MDINEIKDRSRVELVAEHRAALRRAELALTGDDMKAYRDHVDTAEIISAELTERDQKAGTEAEDRFANLRDADGNIDPAAVTGEAGKALARSEYDNFLGRGRELRSGDMGDYFRGLALDSWSQRATELRVQTEGTDTEGGHTVPTPVAARVHDLVMAQLAARRAGVTVVPMTAMTNKLPKLTDRGSAAWRNENASLTSTSLTFGAVTFTANSLAALVLVSRELLADSAISFEQFIAREIGKTMALELDRVVWNGSGSAPEPDGVIDAAGINDTSLSGAAPSWRANDALMHRVVAKDYAPTAIVTNPRYVHDLHYQQDSTGQFVSPSQYQYDVFGSAGANYVTTTQIPANLGVGTDETLALCGDFSELAIGLREDVSVQVLRERYADNGQIGFVFHMRGDVQLLNAAGIEQLSDIGPAA